MPSYLEGSAEEQVPMPPTKAAMREEILRLRRAVIQANLRTAKIVEMRERDNRAMMGELNALRGRVQALESVPVVKGCARCSKVLIGTSDSLCPACNADGY